MRTAFQARLAALDAALTQVSGRARHAVHAATAAALQGDLAAAEAVISDVVEIEDLAREVAEDATAVVARQQPVAKDLRALLSAGRIAGSWAGIARLAGDVAKTTRRAYPRPVVPAEVAGVVADMGEVADRMLMVATAAMAGQDPGGQSALGGLVVQMDRLHREMLRIVRSPAWPHAVDAAVELTLMSRDYERIADHAVDISGAVVYIATGVPPPAPKR